MKQPCDGSGPAYACSKCNTAGPESLTPAQVQSELSAKAEAFRKARASGLYANSVDVAEAVRLQGLTETTPRGERYFTRSEVVAALRTLKTTVDNFNAHEALDCAIRAFQRME